MDSKKLKTQNYLKIKLKSRCNLKTLLELPNLERALICKDNSIDSKYYKFLGWFTDDSEAYSAFFIWNNDFNHFETWSENSLLKLENMSFKINKVEASCNIWELIRNLEYN